MTNTSITVVMLTTNQDTGMSQATIEVAGNTIAVKGIDIPSGLNEKQRHAIAIDKGLEDNPDLVLTRADSEFWRKIKANQIT